MFKGYLNSAIGIICVEDNGKAVTAVRLCEHAEESKTSALTENALIQLDEYFSGRRKQFDLPLELHGTDFQMRVWKALLAIPYGETRSYKEIAEAIGNPKAVRAVGGANNKNKILILVPCHRVIGADGALTGFAAGTDIKQKLLDTEKTNTAGN